MSKSKLHRPPDRQPDRRKPKQRQTLVGLGLNKVGRTRNSKTLRPCAA
jgi:ribosomal protein L30/L7E